MKQNYHINLMIVGTFVAYGYLLKVLLWVPGALNVVPSLVDLHESPAVALSPVAVAPTVLPVPRLQGRASSRFARNYSANDAWRKKNKIRLSKIRKFGMHLFFSKLRKNIRLIGLTFRGFRNSKFLDQPEIALSWPGDYWPGPGYSRNIRKKRSW